MARHTPGPFTPCFETFDGDAVGFHITEHVAGSCRPIASFRQKLGAMHAYPLSSGEIAANGNLFAAAPELLEALKTTEGNIRSLGCAGALDQIPSPYRGWLKVVQEAIAKAEGR
jgi:hypothetical protein